MKVFKHKETGHTITEHNENHYNIYERMGYVEVLPKKKVRKVNK